MDNNDVMGMFNEILGKDDKHGYHCNRCGYEMPMLSVKTMVESYKKMFYCKNNRCERFGVVTVVAKVKNK